MNLPPPKVAMRLLICLILVLVTAPAWAAWEKAASSDKGIFYIDPATIRKNGDLREVWQMEDFKTKRPDGAMSARILREFDCKGERVRVLESSEHTGEKATGKTLKSKSDAGKWGHIPPSTVIAVISKTVCSR